MILGGIHWEWWYLVASHQVKGEQSEILRSHHIIPWKNRNNDDISLGNTALSLGFIITLTHNHGYGLGKWNKYTFIHIYLRKIRNMTCYKV